MMMFVDGMSKQETPRRGVEIACFSADLAPMSRRQPPLDAPRPFWSSQLVLIEMMGSVKRLRVQNFIRRECGEE
jgi:hypothetical protein